MPYNADIDHRRSVRLTTWDYRDTGAYFVTICTHNRECLFDDPRFRTIVEDLWHAIPEHFPTAATDAFVAMPNHVHGIIWIQREPTVGLVTPVGARHASPLRPDHPQPIANHPDGAPAGSLGAMVGSFKSASAKRINEMRGTPAAPVWQRNYYERILRNDRELDRAREYILDNPRKWPEDKTQPRRVPPTTAIPVPAVGARHASPLRPDYSGGHQPRYNRRPTISQQIRFTIDWSSKIR